MSIPEAAKSEVIQLYRHFDKAGKLLYVGISLNAVYRLAQHRDCAHWFEEIARIDIELFPNRREALFAERKAIANENPRHNLARPAFPSEATLLRFRSLQETKKALTHSVVMRPTYKIDELTGILNIGGTAVRRLIESGEIGTIKLNNGKTIRRIVTGWQLIEYLEHKMAKSK